MYKNHKIAVIIAAAGLGTRMGSGIPKQYLDIEGKPMLLKTTEAFHANEWIDDIVVVTSKEAITHCNELFSDAGIKAIVTEGGRERQDSVYNGLKILPPDTEYVLIHDAARPFVTQGIIDDIIKEVCEKSAVVTSVPVKDTIRMRVDSEGMTRTLKRSDLYAAQTPQAFEKNLIFAAYEKAFADGFYGTDDAVLVERMGEPVYLMMGAYENIKITTRVDLPAETSVRVGTGFDVHAFCKTRALVLGGVEVPFDKGLAGHSDADVLVHAVMDSLLGAAALGDIGKTFPDNDARYKGISSILLLQSVAGMLKEAGYAIGNIDATVIAEKPKIAPYTKQMIQNIATKLGIGEDKINIKGTTTEKLGFTGREEGIAAEAVCILYKIKENKR